MIKTGEASQQTVWGNQSLDQLLCNSGIRFRFRVGLGLEVLVSVFFSGLVPFRFVDLLDLQVLLDLLDLLVLQVLLDLLVLL